MRDARGRAVTLLDPMRDWLADQDRTIPRETLDAVIREATGNTRADRRRLLAGLAAFALILLAALAGVGASVLREGPGARADLAASLLLTGPALLAMAAAGVWLPLELARRARLSRLRRAMLRHARCPHCGYGLRGVPTQPGEGPGVVVCPECACAWHESDLG